MNREPKTPHERHGSHRRIICAKCGFDANILIGMVNDHRNQQEKRAERADAVLRKIKDKVFIWSELPPGIQNEIEATLKEASGAWKTGPEFNMKKVEL